MFIVTQIPKTTHPFTLFFFVKSLYACGVLIDTTTILKLERLFKEIRQMIVGFK